MQADWTGAADGTSMSTCAARRGPCPPALGALSPLGANALLFVSEALRCARGARRATEARAGALGGKRARAPPSISASRAALRAARSLGHLHALLRSACGRLVLVRLPCVLRAPGRSSSAARLARAQRSAADSLALARRTRARAPFVRTRTPYAYAAARWRHIAPEPGDALLWIGS